MTDDETYAKTAREKLVPNLIGDAAKILELSLQCAYLTGANEALKFAIQYFPKRDDDDSDDDNDDPIEPDIPGVPNVVTRSFS